MLQLLNIRKSYTTGDFTQVALDDVSISFRDNEFVAVLGPSGSGKTTMLNIVGGLDHYDAGDLIIDEVSTDQYKDRDWDTYRNNRIGFVFQSYNLIPHQSVLANVELALTLAGVSRAERRRRAVAALEEVGLGQHVAKLPSQLSGGQMQRVAIARSLINDPEILLADEPTGALDSKTSVQIMGLLTEIAKDRLVIMVTHNPELAEQYATRIVTLSDGVVVSDTDPYRPQPGQQESKKPARRTSMSFLTAIALSFTNLMTKKGRTLMTAFAGSIGIVGIAAILALANGVNAYIKNIEEETLSMYPLSIMNQGMDMTAWLTSSTESGDAGAGAGSSNGEQGNDDEIGEYPVLARMFSGVNSNDLESLKRFLDDDGGGIEQYVNSIEYSYDVTPQIFSTDTTSEVRQVNPDSTFSALGLGGAGASGPLASALSTDAFAPLMADLSLVESQYDVVAGGWPTRYDELVVVLTPGGRLSDFMLYTLGLRDPAELDRMVEEILDEQSITTPDTSASFTREQVMDVTFTLVNATDYYVYDSAYDVWTDKSDDESFLRQLVADGEDLHVAGIVQPKSDSSAAALSSGIYYPSALTTHIIEQSAQSEIVQAQLAAPGINVFTGRSFAEDARGEQMEDFDLSSLVSIDQEAIAKAITVDESKLSIDTSAFDIDMPEISVDPSALPQLDLDQVLAGLDLSDVITVPDAASQPDAPTTEPDTEQATRAVAKLLEGYLAFAIAGGHDASDAETTLPLFLESADGQAALQELAASLVVDAEPQSPLAQSYLAYALAKGLDPSDLEATLPAFLESPEGQAALADSGYAIDLAPVERQLQAAITVYLQQVMSVYSEQIGGQIAASLQSQIGDAMESAMGQLAANMSDAMGIDEEAFADAFEFTMDPDELTRLLMSLAASEQNTYERNLSVLGYADFDNPSRIDLYPVDFESKGHIIDILDDYNAQQKAQGNDDQVITYTDIVGTLMSSVTDIVNMVSYVLVAFVAISLVVSSIMIGVITYISVLERRKEIGILRAVGASKGDVGRVFNAETLIVGFVAGVMGIGITLLLTIPANAIVLARFDVANVAQLPWAAALILVGISMALTFLAGLIPSSAASRKDPVEALRGE